jgi:hypothetical protein
VKDDADPTNNSLELQFTGLDECLSYTLEIDRGASDKKQYLFTNKKYGRWFEK